MIARVCVLLTCSGFGLTGCGAGWFDVPTHAHRAQVAECAPVPADQRVLTYGSTTLVPICEDLYVEPTTTEPVREYLRRSYVAALRHNEHFYGRLLALRPVTVLCGSDPCLQYFVGPNGRPGALPENGHAEGADYYGDERRTIVLRLRRHLGQQLAHELSHVELHYRVGDAVLHVPAWFNEGLATLVGEDPPCGDDTPRDPIALRSLDDQDDWNHFTDDRAHDTGTYCAAHDEVAAWFASHGQRGLITLLRNVKHGTSFDAEYGPMLTQH